MVFCVFFLECASDAVPLVCPPGFFSGDTFFPRESRAGFPQKKIVPLFLPAAWTLDYFFIVYRLHIRIPHDFLMKNDWSFGLLEWLHCRLPESSWHFETSIFGFSVIKLV